MSNVRRSERAPWQERLARGCRVCTGCGAEKPLAEFYAKRAAPGTMAECKACFRARMARRRLEDRLRAQRRQRRPGRPPAQVPNYAGR
jgi:hypothetical protein